MQNQPIVFPLLFILMMSPCLYAKKVEITPMAGYGFGGSFEEVKSTSSYETTKRNLDESGLFSLAVDVDIKTQKISPIAAIISNRLSGGILWGLTSPRRDISPLQLGIT